LAEGRRKPEGGRAVPEGHSPLVGWPQAKNEGLDEQAPHREDLDARVLHTGEHGIHSSPG
jgi:hypothetical protein